MDLEQRAEEHFQSLGAIPQTGGRLGDTTHTDDKDKDMRVESAAKRMGSARLRVASVVLADFQDPDQKREQHDEPEHSRPSSQHSPADHKRWHEQGWFRWVEHHGRRGPERLDVGAEEQSARRALALMQLIEAHIVKNWNELFIFFGPRGRSPNSRVMTSSGSSKCRHVLIASLKCRNGTESTSEPRRLLTSATGTTRPCTPHKTHVRTRGHEKPGTECAARSCSNATGVAPP